MSWISVPTIGDLVARAADRYGEKDCLAFPDERIGFASFSARVDEFARALLALDVRRGDHVAILMPNSVEYMVALFGAATIGAVAIPVNGRSKRREIQFLLQHADITVLVTSDPHSDYTDFPSMLQDAIPSLSEADPFRLDVSEAPTLRQIISFGSPRPGVLEGAGIPALAASISVEDLQERRSRVRLRDIGMLLFTSGTTSDPKGCMLTHEAVVRNGINFAETRFLLTEHDRMWDPLPFFHMTAILPFLGCLHAGSAMHPMRRFDPDAAVRQFIDDRCTIAYATFETIWQPILDHPDFSASAFSHVRLVFNVGVPERLRSMVTRMPHAAHISCFGATEASGAVCYNEVTEELESQLNTCGRPFPGMEIRAVRPETNTPLPPGEVGELVYRGYALFEGYYKAPELTAAAIDADGWFHGGDLGTVDEAGRVSYRGRLKDMLKVGGENIAAIEIENYLSQHPDVKVVAVVGAPDDRLQEVPAAFVQLAPGSILTEQDIIDFCVGEIASFKIPRYVRFVDDWPMSGTKIQKFRLREQIAEELQRVAVS